MTSMTSRERVNRAIERKPHDRVPRYESIWQDTLVRWEKKGLKGGFEVSWALYQEIITMVDKYGSY